MSIYDLTVALPQGFVLGEGQWGSPLMIVGEAPGAEETKQLRPFVGRSGQLLRRELDELGVGSTRVWITNVYKLRPENNATPTEDQITEHLPYLQAEVVEGLPKYLLALGSTAFHTLTDSPLGITLYRGIWHSVSERIKPKYESEGMIEPVVMPTFHPSYVLRNKKVIEVWRRDLEEWATRQINP
jgi:DNA polymerase